MPIYRIDGSRVAPSQNPLSSRTAGRWEGRQGGACDMCSMTLAQLDQALLRAAENGTSHLIEALRLHGALINTTNWTPGGRLIFPLDYVGWTAMHYAAANGHSTCLYLLWQLGADESQATPIHKWTPLHLAAAYGHVQATEMLLDLGCPVDSRSAGDPGGTLDAWGGSTALHVAAAMGQEHTIEVLHRLHANVSIRDYRGRTALEVAKEAAALGGYNCTPSLKLLRRIEEYQRRFVMTSSCIRKTPLTVRALPSDFPPGERIEALPIRTIVQDEETEEYGHSTGGDSYSAYASAFGSHKFGSASFRAQKKAAEEALDRERALRGSFSASSCESVLTDWDGNGTYVKGDVKYNFDQPSFRRLWARMELGEGLLSEGDADSDCRAPLAPSAPSAPSAPPPRPAAGAGAACGGGGGGGVALLKLPIVPGGAVRPSGRRSLAELVYELEEYWRRAGDAWSQVREEEAGALDNLFRCENKCENANEDEEDDGLDSDVGWWQAPKGPGEGHAAQSELRGGLNGEREVFSNGDCELVLEGMDEEESGGGVGLWGGMPRVKRSLDRRVSAFDSGIVLAASSLGGSGGEAEGELERELRGLQGADTSGACDSERSHACSRTSQRDRQEQDTGETSGKSDGILSVVSEGGAGEADEIAGFAPSLSLSLLSRALPLPLSRALLPLLCPCTPPYCSPLRSINAL
jgi:hypothetical protein